MSNRVESVVSSSLEDKAGATALIVSNPRRNNHH